MITAEIRNMIAMEFPERHHTPQNVLLKGFKMFFEACCFFY